MKILLAVALSVAIAVWLNSCALIVFGRSPRDFLVARWMLCVSTPLALAFGVSLLVMIG